MRSIRWRLTLAYALALTITMGAFGATLYFTRQQTGLRTFDQQLGERLLLEATLSARYLNESHRILGRIIELDSPPTLAPGVAPYFESFRDFLVLGDTAGRVLYASDSASAWAGWASSSGWPFWGCSPGDRCAERRSAPP